MAGNLAGPDPDRLVVALEEGNQAGFTDNLDHVFLANGATVVDSRRIGHEWPDGEDVWECSSPDQVETTETASSLQAEAGVGEPIAGRGVCLPTDHAGAVAVVDVSAGPAGVVTEAAPPDHDSFRIGLLGWIVIILVVLVLLLVLLIWGVVALIRRYRRVRTSSQAQ
jgi:hypothetical protein